MSLASTQSDIDSALASTLSSIASAQTTYFGTYGKYWQGLISHATIPADGNSVAADKLSLTPTDQVVTWATFGVTPGTIPCALLVDTYKDQDGNHGYTVKKLFIYAGSQYSTTTDSGAEPGRADAWDSTADPAPEVVSTYSATCEAFCTSGSDVSGVGTVSWTNPTNIYASDSTFASYDATGGDVTTHYLLAKTYGFAIPTDAVIDGIEVTTYRGASDNATHTRADDSTIKLFYGGSAVGTNQSTGSHWADGGGLKTFGGATSTWGYSGYLTSAIVNSSTFGVGISAAIEDVEAYVDYVKMKVYYTVDAARATPTITSLDVSTGTISGGTAITITGTGFKNGCTVTFGGSAATSIVVASSTSITCLTPAHSAGAVDVVITNIDSKSVTSSNAYTFASVSPTYRQYDSRSGTNSGGLTFSFPSTPNNGNVMVVVLASNSGVSWSSPAGWTQIQSGTTGAQAYYKVASSESNSYNFDDGGSSKSDAHAGVAVEISNTAASPIDASASSTGVTTTPSVTTTQANDLVLALACGGAGTFTGAPSGWTLVATVPSGLIVAAMAYKSFASAGATGTATWTSSSGTKTFTVAVKS